VTPTKPPESEPSKPQETLSAEADDWIRQFVKHLELHLIDARRDLPPDAGVSESHAATARAILRRISIRARS
jgi:hypothetical protein